MSNPNNPNLFQKFAGLLTLFGGALYFTGWIYRWAYFSFFQLEITTLNFPPQSFLFVPIQVFFGSFSTQESLKQMARSIFLFLVIIYLAIPLTLWLVQQISSAISGIFNFFKTNLQNLIQDRHQKLQNHLNHPAQSQKTKKYWFELQLHKFFALLLNSLKPIKLKPIDYQKSLWDETIIILWILILLFFLARNQGITDAQKDARKDSKLPSITLIVPEDTLAFGNTSTNPQTLEGFQIIGDVKRYNDINEKTTINDLDNELFWRLLLDSEGFFYLFRSLPEDAPPNQRPTLLIVQGSLNGNSLVILSPSPFTEEEATEAD